MKIETIVRWYRSGEDYAQAVQLLKAEGLDIATFQHPSPQKYQLLKNKLFSVAGCNEFDIHSWTGTLEDEQPDEPKANDQQEENKVEVLPNQNVFVARKTCRELYPKINWDTAPDEIKLLFSDQITCYYNFRDAHALLQDTPDGEESRGLCEKIIENVTKNRKCIHELQYFNDHGQLLKPKRRKREMDIDNILSSGDKLEISKLLLKCTDAIKDTKREIKKGNKPELNQSRNETIARNEAIIIRCNALLV